LGDIQMRVIFLHLGICTCFFRKRRPRNWLGRVEICRKDLRGGRCIVVIFCLCNSLLDSCLWKGCNRNPFKYFHVC
jgi:hypothetical protein